MNPAEVLRVLNRAVEFVGDYSDVDDGPDGMQVPNNAMSLTQDLMGVIGTLAPDRADAERLALAHFTEYFVRNYPGPDTIISRPEWHAPKIFRAALYALDAARSQRPAPAAPTAAMRQGTEREPIARAFYENYVHPTQGENS